MAESSDFGATHHGQAGAPDGPDRGQVPPNITHPTGPSVGVVGVAANTELREPPELEQVLCRLTDLLAEMMVLNIKIQDMHARLSGASPQPPDQQPAAGEILLTLREEGGPGLMAGFAEACNRLDRLQEQNLEVIVTLEGIV